MFRTSIDKARTSRRHRLAIRFVVVALSAATIAVTASSAHAYTGEADSANARFVVDGYQQLLGRQADTGGLDFHLSRLAAGGDRSRHAFAYSLLFSVEGSRQEVGRAYGDLLGRAPDAEGATYWTDHLQGHGVLDLRVLLLASEEYWQRSGGTDQAWIEALYLDTVQRAADPDGLAYWLGEAQSGVPRALIAAGLYLSGEALGNRVDAYYAETLDREPTATERADAIATIGTGGERDLRARLWADDELFERYLEEALA